MDTCPRCKKSMQGPQIPAEYLYGTTAERVYYSRIIGVEIRGVFDGVAYWQCPDCGWAWHRFDESNSRWKKIDPWVKEVQDLFPDSSKPSAGEHG